MMAELVRHYFTGFSKPACNGVITEQWSFDALPGETVEFSPASDETVSYRLTSTEPDGYVEGFVRTDEVLH